METTIVYWGNIGIYWDNGKEDGKYSLVALKCSILHYTRPKSILSYVATRRHHVPTSAAVASTSTRVLHKPSVCMCMGCPSFWGFRVSITSREPPM